MWTVAKIKTKELNIFKKNLIEKFGKNTKFYHPKIQHHKYINNKIRKFEKLILENYIFCYNEKFQESANINNATFLKGLLYFLDGYAQNQKEIVKFIEYCKSCENKEGYLNQNFFKSILLKKAQFISGPFTNMIFEVIEKQKNKLKILIGNVVTTISDRKNCLYRPV